MNRQARTLQDLCHSGQGTALLGNDNTSGVSKVTACIMISITHLTQTFSLFDLPFKKKEKKLTLKALMQKI